MRPQGRAVWSPLSPSFYLLPASFLPAQPVTGTVNGTRVALHDARRRAIHVRALDSGRPRRVLPSGHRINRNIERPLLLHSDSIDLARVRRLVSEFASALDEPERVATGSSFCGEPASDRRGRIASMAALTRGELKALALHRTVASRLRGDPSLVSLVRTRLEWLRAKNAASARYYDEWSRLLSGPLDALLDVMVSPSERACALRQESPFVDLVDQRERARIYRALSNDSSRATEL